MAKQVVTRTYTASIRNQSRVQDDLDSLGFAASKLWNVGRWTCSRIWDEIDHIPNHNELTTYLKTHERYDDLHSQSSQRVLQELAEAFNGWYGKRQNGDTKANPPGYRKHGDEHPRSTVTFKQKGFKLDTQYDRVRLSKGSNLKEYWSDFVLCTYQTRPDVDLSAVENVQQVKIVWTGDEWELHFVCKVEMDVAEAPGEKTVGVDLGINNFAALAYEDGHSELYPLNCLKQDDYYFSKRIARCDDSDSEQATRLNQKKSARRTHYFHTLSKHIVQRCVDQGVGTIVIGPVSARPRRTASQKTGGNTAILTYTRGRSTGSPTSSNTKPRWKASRLSKCLSGIPRNRARAVAGSVTRTVLNAGYMSVMSAGRQRTRT